MFEGTDVDLEDEKDNNESKSDKVSNDSVRQSSFSEEEDNLVNQQRNFFSETDQKQTINCEEV